jgi:hypothetical protein
MDERLRFFVRPVTRSPVANTGSGGTNHAWIYFRGGASSEPTAD